MSSRARWLIGISLMMVAVAAATTLIVLLTRQKEAAIVEVPLVAVIVPIQNVGGNQPLDPLVEKGFFVEILVPVDARVKGAVTDLSRLAGTATTMGLRAQEQIPDAQLTMDRSGEGFLPPA